MNSDAQTHQARSKRHTILHCAKTASGLVLQQAANIAELDCDFTALDDADQVIATLLGKHHDLVLIDADSMPNAVEGLVRSIRKRFPATECPILISHSAATRAQRDAAMAAGANDCFSTPIDAEEIAFRIRHCLRQGNDDHVNKTLQDILKTEIKNRTSKLDMLIESGLMMSMERNRSQLLRHILVEGQRLLNCDGGTMFLMTDANTLRFAERTRVDYLPFAEIALYDVNGRPNDVYASTYAALHNETVVIDDVYREHRFDCSGTRDFDARSGYHTVSLLTVPMAPRGGKVIGILQFFNAKSVDTGELIPFPPDTAELVGALAAQAAVALDNLQLVQSQKDTTENIIRIIANALDSKSPHTGHHCVRVPELAFMLAAEACRETEGPLADFNFASEDEWFEFRVGAWLHDCGKITTPEYVIEKATKLDVIYNRIHEIRLRFEVLLRDAEIACLQARLKGGEAPSRTDARLAQITAELQDDFAFLAECNLGKEAMDAADVERIERIAQRKWLRYFDDRLGLSREELLRRQQEPVFPLPAEEYILSDKPYHVVPRPQSKNSDSHLGIKMVIPEHLYNFGEIYNLSVQKGTLTAEDRYKINEHIIETIKMLEQMPFPEALQRVPEYATTHHETLDGRGYPRKLTADDLSIPARIMAIADIFEALTSSDRPYKQPYKLSEALNILHGMKQRRHIDPDLFDLFVRSGTYRKFAEQFLAPEQIDDVDIDQYLQTPLG